MNYSKFGQRITEARKAEEMSKTELADAIGVSTATTTDWEKGKIKSLKAENLMNLSRILRVTPEWLYFGKPPKQYNNLPPELQTWLEFGAGLPEEKRQMIYALISMDEEKSGGINKQTTPVTPKDHLNRTG
ncbi:MAG: helix-turn-helix transcriptional regulator [Candidatus Thiodiazotropha sp.]